MANKIYFNGHYYILGEGRMYVGDRVFHQVKGSPQFLPIEKCIPIKDLRNKKLKRILK